MAFSKKNVDNPSPSPSFFKLLSANKTAEVSFADKLFYQITCGAGALFALVSMLLLLIQLGGYDPTYTWSAVALGVGSFLFYGLAALRYQFPTIKILGRFADASVFFTLFAAYTPITLILVRQALFENGEIVTGWVTFGLIALFSAVFFLTSLILTGTKFRMFASFVYILMALSLLFSIPALLKAYFFSHVLIYVLVILSMLLFAATPIIFWFFDSKAWQMKVFYILMAVGTLAASLISVIWAFCG